MRYFIVIVALLFTTACFHSTKPSPVITLFKADSNLLSQGDNTVLRWDVSGNVEVRIDTNIGIPVGNVPNVGNVIITPLFTTIYTLTARAGSLSVQQSLTVFVE
jgi:hypothetical protein